jgi:hypothetical protein
LVVNPFDTLATFLSAEFFSGELSAELLSKMDYHVEPSTDDWPYFNNIQNGLSRVTVDPERFLDESMMWSINGRLEQPLGEFTIFAGIGVVALLLSAVSVWLPLARSVTGRDAWSAKYLSLGFFACLGSGFIIIELVLIQIFMKLVGFPVYTFSVVLCTTLAAAGLGSMAAHRFDISPTRRWAIPFVGILACGAALLWTYPSLFDRLLVLSTFGRALASILMIFPLTFFLGMPFPLGILSLDGQPTGSIAWAWGTNALFTVIGGVTAGVLSIFLGFKLTLWVALGIYLLAFALFARMRRSRRREFAILDPVSLNEELSA